MHCILQDAIVAIKAMCLIKRWGLQQTGATLILFGIAVVKVNATPDATGAMKERLVF
jgi:hypothetical protein